MSGSRHWDVGAYVLGALDPTELERFETHLATCGSCAEELEALLPVAQRLPLADAGDFMIQFAADQPVAEPVSAIDRSSTTRSTPPPVRPRDLSERRGRPLRHRPRVLAVVGSAALVLAAGTAFVAGARWTHTDVVAAAPTDPAAATLSTAWVLATPTDSGAGPQPPGVGLAASDAGTGVSAEVRARDLPYGTAIALTLRGVRGPQRCELAVIDGVGGSTVVATWSVPEPGYGLLEHPTPLRIETVTALPLAAIERFEIRRVSAIGGRATVLVTLVR